MCPNWKLKVYGFKREHNSTVLSFVDNELGRESNSEHISFLVCDKGYYKCTYKLQPISDIYKRKISYSSFIYKENSVKLLKYICKKDWVCIFWCSGVSYLEFIIVLSWHKQNYFSETMILEESLILPWLWIKVTNKMYLHGL